MNTWTHTIVSKNPGLESIDVEVMFEDGEKQFYKVFKVTSLEDLKEVIRSQISKLEQITADTQEIPVGEELDLTVTEQDNG